MDAREPFPFCPHCAAPMDPRGGPRDNPACGKCGFVQWWDPKVATGVVVEYRGEVLLVRRNHEPAYGRWSFPSGFVDAGEIVEEAAAREVLEETGVQVSIDRLLGVYSTAGERTIFVAFAGVATSGEPGPGDEEVMEVGLFAPDALPELAFPHDPAILAAWREWREARG
ncbi:MAG: NUDIX domain-containing protein [Dehalococcoidia bacterium]